MRILISNDDGVHSPGLQVLAEIATGLGEVRVVAPDHEQSSMSHAVTLTRPLTYRRVRLGQLDTYTVNGTPADCIALGFKNWEAIDLVLSGINHGHNLGNSVWHSGTLAAAKQAALFGARGIALSAPSFDTVEEYAPLRPWIERAILSLAHAMLPLVNVNFPAEPKGLAWARQSVRHYAGRVIPAEDPHGNQHFWFSAEPIEATDPDTDRALVDAGVVAMTPLRLDLTDHEALARLRGKP
jgi:5'-nucleotidase